MTLGSASERYVDQAADRVHRTLGPELVGVYLHGSGALGGFVPERSDVDVLVVSAGSLDDDAKKELASRLSKESLPCPATGLELSVVTLETARTPPHRPPFELHLATGSNPKVIDGRNQPGDPDLILHFAVCRSHGRAITGPDPTSVFAEIPREWILQGMADELAWAEDHERWTDGVLNACRNWRYLEEEVIGSKVDGAIWAMARPGQDEDLISAALDAKVRGSGEPKAEAATGFIQEIRSLLKKETFRGDADPGPQ